MSICWKSSKVTHVLHGDGVEPPLGGEDDESSLCGAADNLGLMQFVPLKKKKAR